MKINRLGMKRLGKRIGNPPGLILYSFCVFVFILLPISMIIVFSFNSARNGVFPLREFTLDWYREVFISAQIVSAAKASLGVAVSVALLSGVLGTLGSLGLARYDFRFKGGVWVLLLMPMILPPLMLGVSLLTYFHSIGLKPSLLTVIIAQTVWAVPYVIFIVYARLRDFDRSIEEAARDLGANRWITFLRVTFPMISSSIIGAMMVIFAWSFDDFVVTFFTIGPNPTLPIIIWGMLRTGITPVLNAIAAMLFTLTLATMLIARQVGRVDIEF
jgi:spermidine/putrescine transport system permease protein